MTLSLCMIVKNEEASLEKCLESVNGIADEIIIVDTGSEDNTKAIASKFTDKIFDFEWINDFSAARNFAFEQAAMDYIIWLDADDVILPTDANALIALKQALPDDTDAVMMKYNTHFDEHGNVTFSYSRERIVKRIRNFKWREPVHEYLDINGRVIRTNICITHQRPPGKAPSRNIHIYENFLKDGKKLSLRGMYYYSRELKDNGQYPEAIQWFEKFLATDKGWIEDKINACGELARCQQALGRSDMALASMMRSFNYDTPRAEICCQIAYHFKSLKKYNLAAFWFELALNLKKPDILGFCRDDCWGYIPCIELAVCHDKLGAYKLAQTYNEKAAKFKPDSSSVAYNRQYFNQILNASYPSKTTI